MTTLRLLALVIIAGMCVTVFALVYPRLRSLSAAQQAEDAASELASDIQDVIITENPKENKSLSIPPDYTLRLENSEEGNLGEWQIKIDEMRFPEDGFDLPVEFKNFTELSPGDHRLDIKLVNGVVVVSKVS